MADEVSASLGVVLAGGAATRMGGAKMTATLAGRPLIAWPLAALGAVLDDVVVVAKGDTPLPRLTTPVWIEPDEPRHPLAGVVHALRRAGGRGVLVCAGDLPLVTPADLRALIGAPRGRAAVARGGGRVQPLLARYETTALAALEAGLPDAPATAAVGALEPIEVDVPGGSLLNVNTSEDLAAAERSLARAGRT
jgi:molybdopterin-guanine dinucleotide biosynthesis protein A